jgi:hypothetical protein
MDLTVETWQEGKNTMVSMCHYGEQNGDLMKDPDVLFKVERITDQSWTQTNHNI